MVTRDVLCRMMLSQNVVYHAFPKYLFFIVALVLSLLSLSVLRTERHTWQIVPSGVSGPLLKITLSNAALISYVSCRHDYEWDGDSTFRLHCPHCPHCCSRRHWNGELKRSTFASHEPKGWAGGYAALPSSSYDFSSPIFVLSRKSRSVESWEDPSTMSWGMGKTKSHTAVGVP